MQREKFLLIKLHRVSKLILHNVCFLQPCYIIATFQKKAPHFCANVCLVGGEGRGSLRTVRLFILSWIKETISFLTPLNSRSQQKLSTCPLVWVWPPSVWDGPRCLFLGGTCWWNENQLCWLPSLMGLDPNRLTDAGIGGGRPESHPLGRMTHQWLGSYRCPKKQSFFLRCHSLHHKSSDVWDWAWRVVGEDSCISTLTFWPNPESSLFWVCNLQVLFIGLVPFLHVPGFPVLSLDLLGDIPFSFAPFI
jgi:hypothetical protein